MFRTDRFFQRVNETRCIKTWKFACMLEKELGTPLEHHLSPKAIEAFYTTLRNSPPHTGVDWSQNIDSLLALVAYSDMDRFAKTAPVSYQSVVATDIVNRYKYSDKLEGQWERRQKYITTVERVFEQFKAKREESKPPQNKSYTQLRYSFARDSKTEAVLYFVKEALLRPYAQIWLPVKMQFILSSAMISKDHAKKISVIGKGVTNTSRLARKTGAVLQDIFRYMPVQLNKAQSDKFLSLFAMYWDWATNHIVVPFMTGGDRIKDVYDATMGIYSCMAKNPNDALDLYATNDNSRVLYLVENDYTQQRCMIFRTQLVTPEGEPIWGIDRLYVSDRTSNLPKIYEALKYRDLGGLKWSGGELPLFTISVLDVEDKNKEKKLVVFNAYTNKNKDAIYALSPYVDWDVHDSGWMPYLDSFCRIEVIDRDKQIVRGWHTDSFCLHSDYVAQLNHSDSICRWDTGATSGSVNNDDEDVDDESVVWSEYHNRYIDRDGANRSDYADTYFEDGCDEFVYVNGHSDWLPVDRTSSCDSCGEAFHENHANFTSTIDGDYICESCSYNYNECWEVNIYGIDRSNYDPDRTNRNYTHYKIGEFNLDYSHVDDDDEREIAEAIFDVNDYEEIDVFMVNSNCRRDYLQEIKDALEALNNIKIEEEKSIEETIEEGAELCVTE